jgi:hypothetical protein
VIELMTSEPVLAALAQMPFVVVMGIIMLGMRQDLRDLRGDLRDCIDGQQAILIDLIRRATENK